MIRKIVSCGTGGVAGAARNTAEKMGVFFGGCDSGEAPSVGGEGKDAFDPIKKHLRLKDKTTVANMAAMELSTLDPSLGEYIRNAYRLWGGNQPLLDSCRWLAAKDRTDNADPAMVIIQELWNELRKTHTLRLVK
mgnify:FL=1